MKKEDGLEYSRALVPSKNTIYKIVIALLIVIIAVLVCIYFNIAKDDVVETMPSGEEITYNINKDSENLEREIGTTIMKIDYLNNCIFTISYPEVGIEEIDDSIVEYANDLKQKFIDEYMSTDENAHRYTQHIDYKSYLEPEDDMKLVFVEKITNDLDIILSNKEYIHYFELSTGNEIDSKRAVVVGNRKNYDMEPFAQEDTSKYELLYSGDIIKFAFTALNVREEASTDSNKLGLLEEGQAVEVVSGDDEWEKIVYEGNFAYVKAGYLSRKKNLHKDVELEILDRGIDPTKPMVAITFDDGPNPKSTPRILDTLEQYNAVATFFDLGQLMEKYPDVVKREAEIGCEIGTHTYSHHNLNVLSDEEMQDEIANAEASFVKVLGHKPTLFRAPYGNANLKVRENWNYPIIKWNIDSLDWKSRNKDKILTEIRKIDKYDGCIILLHSIYSTTADAIEILVPELIDRGYQLVTISELAFYKGNTVLKTAEEYRSF